MFEFGIGITTRNRPDVLKICLRHLREYLPEETCKIIVVDDASSPENFSKNRGIVASYKTFSYDYSAERKGIAKAKNACLNHLTACKHIFLFDDDCFPNRPNWFDVWLAPKLAHLTFSMDLRSLVDAPADSAHLHRVAEGQDWEAFSGGLGCCLYLQNKVLNLVGAFDPNFGIYGYEHAQFSKRCHMAGLSPHEYTAPKGVLDSIYSIDMHWRWLARRPSLPANFDSFDTSVTREEAAKHVEYAHLMQKCKIFIPLRGAPCESE